MGRCRRSVGLDIRNDANWKLRVVELSQRRPWVPLPPPRYYEPHPELLGDYQAAFDALFARVGVRGDDWAFDAFDGDLASFVFARRPLTRRFESWPAAAEFVAEIRAAVDLEHRWYIVHLEADPVVIAHSHLTVCGGCSELRTFELGRGSTCARS